MSIPHRQGTTKKRSRHYERERRMDVSIPHRQGTTMFFEAMYFERFRECQFLIGKVQHN